MNICQVCAVGFEPNMHLSNGLEDLEDAYNRCGYRTIINTLTGVDIASGKAQVWICQRSGYIALWHTVHISFSMHVPFLYMSDELNRSYVYMP